ncbi:MAG: hypothetical protein ABF296_07465, partial [Oceanococcaceae bacterium]
NKLVCEKSPDDLRNLIRARIAEHAEREAAKEPAAPAATPAPPAAGASSPPSTAGAAECQPGTRDEELAAYDGGHRIKLKDINDAIAPLTITQAGLSELGIESVGREKNAVLYCASDFRIICSRLIGRLHAATLTTQRAAA